MSYDSLQKGGKKSSHFMVKKVRQDLLIYRQTFKDSNINL